ncbi:MAG: ABC transporter permease subunit [Candidatus Bathyarchaeota archaeon]|nr:ABC transporter permease subunit [Candidatus Bathyarchaeota archaeon]
MQAERTNLLKPKIAKALDKLSSKTAIKNTIYIVSIIIFFALILFPPILGIIIKWGSIEDVLNQPELMSEALNAIAASFAVAFFVSFIDVVAGVPMAWMITRGNSKWLSVLDTLSDIPFIVPTATLGYSLFLFWGDLGGLSSLFGVPFVSRGWLLVVLLHFAFSFPVVVRVMVGASLDYKLEYEQASRTLGAAPLTAARTVTFPILKHSLIASFTLAFARSLSETGATMMVAGAFVNGPIFINKHIGEAGPLVFVSAILIVLSSLVFVTIRLLGPRLKMPVRKVWPKAERKLSSSTIASSRNGITLLVFLVIVLVPSLFVAVPAFEAIFAGVLPEALGGVGVWGDYWQSISLSYFVGIIVTLLNVVIGLPMAIIIARRKIGNGPSAVLDVLVNIPIIVPSVALGASLAIFWENFAFMPEIWLLIFAHLSITYPYFVRSMSAAVERISMELEEAGRTLGAKPLGVFRTIIFPLTKYSMLSGAIMMFTRSVSETGATLVVSNLVTAPVLLVNWVKNEVPTSTLGLGCGFLILFSFIILLVLRLVVKGRETY